MRIADGKFVEHRGSNEHLGLIRQVGAIPSPGAERLAANAGEGTERRALAVRGGMAEGRSP
jgi:hypothetical protein